MIQNQALDIIRLAREVHEGKRHFSPEIIRINQEIEEAERQARLFLIKFKQVDEGMIYNVVALLVERDRLYGQWIDSQLS